MSSMMSDLNEKDAKYPWQQVDEDEKKLHVEMAITGKAFEYMVEARDTDSEGTTDAAMVLKKIIRNARVFARMSPEGKAMLVTELQNETGEIIAMCGDGANDCNALKTADVGLSLSEAEASIAAPFTSKIPDISPILRLLREGRSSLVTSFAAFKYMELYSMIQFCTVIILYRIASNLGDWQYLYIDLFNIIPLSIIMGYTGSYHKLSKQMPTGALISIPVLASVMSQILIQAGFQIGIFFYLKQQTWYEKLVPYDGKNIRCQENSVLYLYSILQYTFIVITFSIAKPFRKPIYTNIGL